MNQIHPTAVVDPRARLGDGITIGPYCIVEGEVELGDACWLQAHVYVAGPSRIGPANRFYAHASIGQRTQDLKYSGEPTHLEIGEGNTFREFVTVNRSTASDGSTLIGNRGNFLAYSHVGHDCRVGDEVVFSNNGTLAGHVQVGDRVGIGGLTAVHQFCRIGRFAFTGGCTKIVQDVPPFMIADGNPAEIRGVNKVGLERAGFSRESLRALREAYRILYRADCNLTQAVERLLAELPGIPEIDELAAFIRASERGVTR